MRTTVFSLSDGQVEFQLSAVPPWADPDEFGQAAAVLHRSPMVLARYTASRPDAPYQSIAARAMRCVRLFLDAGSWSSQVVRKSTTMVLRYSFLSPEHCTVGMMSLKTRC